MENQKIQQLIRLASIADNNGDYKIADKLFEKLAAAPPPLKVPRMRVFEDFMKWVNREAGTLEKLLTRIKDLKHLKKEIDKHKNSDSFKNADDLDGFYNSVKDAMKNLPEKKSLLESKQRELASEELKIAKDMPKIALLKFDIETLKENVESMEYNFENMGAIFEDMSAPPGLTYSEIEEKLTEIEEELAKVKPQDLEKNDPNRIALETMAAQFEKSNQEALHQTIRSRAPITRQVQVDSTKTKAPGKILAPFTGTTEVNRTQYTKDKINLFNIVKRVFTVQDFKEAFARFARHKTIVDSKTPETQGNIPQGIVPMFQRNSFIFKSSEGASTAAIVLKDNLKDMIDLYDYKFVVQYIEEVRVLSLKRAEEIKNNPRIGMKPFDPIKNQEDFTEAANAALSKLQQDPTGEIILGLFQSIKSFINREKALAEEFIRFKNQTPDDISTTRQIALKNPGFLRDAGLTQSNLKTIITEGDNFSIEDFLDFAPGSVKRLEKPSIVLVKGLLKATLWKGPLVIPIMGIVNYFTPGVYESVKRTILAPFEKRKRDEAVESREDRAKKSRERAQRNIP